MRTRQRKKPVRGELWPSKKERSRVVSQGHLRKERWSQIWQRGLKVPLLPCCLDINRAQQDTALPKLP